jgi:hypothetical protein
MSIRHNRNNCVEESPATWTILQASHTSPGQLGNNRRQSVGKLNEYHCLGFQVGKRYDASTVGVQGASCFPSERCDAFDLASSA